MYFPRKVVREPSHPVPRSSPYCKAYAGYAQDRCWGRVGICALIVQVITPVKRGREQDRASGQGRTADGSGVIVAHSSVK